MMHGTLSVATPGSKHGSRLRKASCAGLVGVALLATSCASNDVNDDPEGNAAANMYRTGPAEGSFSLWEEPGDNLLAALTEVEDNDAESVLPVDNRVLGHLLGEVGAYFSATAAYTPFAEVLEPQSMVCAGSVLPDAIETLCTVLSEPREPDEDSVGGPLQFVLVNELQHVAYQRSLVRQLLSCAWDAGFRYLGIEALEEDDAALEARGYVSKAESGVLMREPQMSRLVDEGLSLGYDIVSFGIGARDARGRLLEQIRENAAQQATNLAAKTVDVDPDAKVLVLTAARQAYKRIWGIEPYVTSLGKHLWDQTGIEPYSIEQVAVDRPTLQFGASAANPPSGMYTVNWNIDPTCMGSYGQGSPTGESGLDANVIHVPPKSDAERWGWLHTPAEERRTITASCAACTAGERLLVQAFPAGIDRMDRVPVDQASCNAGAACQLALPAASYDIVVWRATGEPSVSTVDLQANTTAAIGG